MTTTALNTITARLLALLPWLVNERDATLYREAAAGASVEEIAANNGLSIWYVRHSLAWVERHLLSCFDKDNLREHMSEWLGRWNTKLLLASVARELHHSDEREKGESLQSADPTPLASLRLNTRSYNVLSRGLSVRSVEQLCTLTRAEILRGRGAGMGVLADVRRTLARDGRCLAEE